MITEQPNLAFLKQQTLNNQAVIEQIISVVKTELPNDIKNYKQALKNKDFTSCAEAVHKFKHKIALFGLNDSLNVADAYEKDLYNKNTKLSRKFEDILTLITTYLKTLN